MSTYTSLSVRNTEYIIFFGELKVPAHVWVDIEWWPSMNHIILSIITIPGDTCQPREGESGTVYVCINITAGTGTRAK